MRISKIALLATTVSTLAISTALATDVGNVKGGFNPSAYQPANPQPAAAATPPVEPPMPAPPPDWNAVNSTISAVASATIAKFTADAASAAQFTTGTLAVATTEAQEAARSLSSDQTALAYYQQQYQNYLTIQSYVNSGSYYLLSQTENEVWWAIWTGTTAQFFKTTFAWYQQQIDWYAKGVAADKAAVIQSGQTLQAAVGDAVQVQNQINAAEQYVGGVGGGGGDPGTGGGGIAGGGGTPYQNALNAAQQKAIQYQNAANQAYSNLQQAMQAENAASNAALAAENAVSNAQAAMKAAQQQIDFWQNQLVPKTVEGWMNGKPNTYTLPGANPEIAQMWIDQAQQQLASAKAAYDAATVQASQTSQALKAATDAGNSAYTAFKNAELRATYAAQEAMNVASLDTVGVPMLGNGALGALATFATSPEGATTFLVASGAVAGLTLALTSGGSGSSSTPPGSGNNGPGNNGPGNNGPGKNGPGNNGPGNGNDQGGGNGNRTWLDQLITEVKDGTGSDRAQTAAEIQSYAAFGGAVSNNTSAQQQSSGLSAAAAAIVQAAVNINGGSGAVGGASGGGSTPSKPLPTIDLGTNGGQFPTIINPDGTSYVQQSGAPSQAQGYTQVGPNTWLAPPSAASNAAATGANIGAGAGVVAAVAPVVAASVPSVSVAAASSNLSTSGQMVGLALAAAKGALSSLGLSAPTAPPGYNSSNPAVNTSSPSGYDSSSPAVNTSSPTGYDSSQPAVSTSSPTGYDSFSTQWGTAPPSGSSPSGYNSSPP